MCVVELTIFIDKFDFEVHPGQEILIQKQLTSTLKEARKPGTKKKGMLQHKVSDFLNFLKKFEFSECFH